MSNDNHALPNQLVFTTNYTLTTAKATDQRNKLVEFLKEQVEIEMINGFKINHFDDKTVDIHIHFYMKNVDKIKSKTYLPNWWYGRWINYSW